VPGEVLCSECGGTNPSGAKACRHCLSSLGTATAAPARTFETVRLREVREVLEREDRWLHLLRWLYVLYAASLAATTLTIPLHADESVPGAARFAYMLMPLISLAMAIVAYRHLEQEPFACALAMAGLQTIRGAGAVAEGVGPSLYTQMVTALLWLAVVVTARSGRILREWQTGLAFDDRRSTEVRTVAAILLLFAGTIAVVMLVPEEPYVRDLVVYGAIVLLGAVAALLLGASAFRQTIPLRCAWGTALLLVAAVTVVHFAFVWWFSGLFAGRWTPAPFAPGSAPSADALLGAVVLAPLCEEWLCRGVLWSAVRRGAGNAATILTTATLFALLHLSAAPAPGILPSQLVGGFLLGWLRVRTGSLLPCVLAHAAFNAAVVLLL
jgi:membrane protease YdiL (CAAX protease family)